MGLWSLYGVEGTEGCHRGLACPGVAPGATAQGPSRSLKVRKRVSVGRSSQLQATLPGGLVAKEGHGDERIRWRRTDGDGAGTGRNKSMRRRAILREAILKSCASTEERLLGENTHLSDPIRGRESRSRSICSLTRLIGGGGNAALTKGSERKRVRFSLLQAPRGLRLCYRPCQLFQRHHWRRLLICRRSAPLLEPAGIALPCPGPGEVVCPLALTPAAHDTQGGASCLRHACAIDSLAAWARFQRFQRAKRQTKRSCRPSVLVSIRGLVDPRCRYGNLGRRR